MSETQPPTFVTYTKGPVQYVTTPKLESLFLDWLNRVGSSAGFTRETNRQVGVRSAPFTVHATQKTEAVILKLVKSDEALK